MTNTTRIWSEEYRQARKKILNLSKHISFVWNDTEKVERLKKELAETKAYAEQLEHCGKHRNND